MPVFDADFVNWDDPIYIYDNDAIVNFNLTKWQSWKDVILDFNPEVSYAPLTSLSFALEKYFIGFDNPEWWHFDNVLLHMGVTLFVFWIGLELGLGLPMAGVLALLFGIHPMRVESVAWLTERKDTLYAFFYFAAILMYVRMKKDSFDWRSYFFILVLFFLSLLSKIQAVTLPVALILIDYLIDQKFELKQLVNKIPLFIMAFAFGLLGLLYTKGGESTSPFTFDLHHSLLWVSTSLWTYLYKFIFPYPLLPIYPFPDQFVWYEYLTLLIPIIGMFLLYIAWTKKQHFIFFGLAFFAINVFLTLPLIPIGQGYAADRFTYVAYFGLYLLFVLGWSRLLDQSYIIRYASIGFGFIYLLGLGLGTYEQSKVWTNSETLWTHQLSHINNLPATYKNRADYYKANNFLRAAESDIDMALKLDPDDFASLYFKGELLISYGQEKYYKEALTFYNRAIAINTSHPSSYVNRAVALGQLNRIKEAMIDLSIAIQMDPNLYDAYKNRAVLYERIGMLTESIQDLNMYLSMNPRDHNIWGVKAKLSNRIGDHKSALQAINQALQFNDQMGVYYFERAVALYYLNDYTNAKINVEKGIDLGYNDQIDLAQKILEAR